VVGQFRLVLKERHDVRHRFDVVEQRVFLGRVHRSSGTPGNFERDVIAIIRMQPQVLFKFVTWPHRETKHAFEFFIKGTYNARVVIPCWQGTRERTSPLFEPGFVRRVHRAIADGRMTFNAATELLEPPATS
jgi:hypothetical protein